jgi:hypothetical protein
MVLVLGLFERIPHLGTDHLTYAGYKKTAHNDFVEHEWALVPHQMSVLLPAGVRKRAVPEMVCMTSQM